MQIKDKEVTLNQREQTTADNLDFKIGVLKMKRDRAVYEALSEHTGRPSKQFVEWLSKGTLTVHEGSIKTAARVAA